MNAIVSHFNIQGNVVEVAPLGNGLINTTYRVKTEGDAPDYVLQHVNNAIFPDVDMLMNNIVAVTNHIYGKLEAAGTADISRKVLKFVPATDGKYYYFDGEKYCFYYRGSGRKNGIGTERDHGVWCVAYSEDGKNFTRPDLKIFDFRGEVHNNIIMQIPNCNIDNR